MLGRTPAAVAAVVVAVMVVTLPSVVCGQYWPSDTFTLSSVNQEYWPKVEQFIYPPDPAYARAATQFEPEIWMRVRQSRLDSAIIEGDRLTLWVDPYTSYLFGLNVAPALSVRVGIQALADKLDGPESLMVAFAFNRLPSASDNDGLFRFDNTTTLESFTYERPPMGMMYLVLYFQDVASSASGYDFEINIGATLQSCQMNGQNYLDPLPYELHLPKDRVGDLDCDEYITEHPVGSAASVGLQSGFDWGGGGATLHALAYVDVPPHTINLRFKASGGFPFTSEFVIEQDALAYDVMVQASHPPHHSVYVSDNPGGGHVLDIFDPPPGRYFYYAGGSQSILITMDVCNATAVSSASNVCESGNTLHDLTFVDDPSDATERTVTARESFTLGDNAFGGYIDFLIQVPELTAELIVRANSSKNGTATVHELDVRPYAFYETAPLAPADVPQLRAAGAVQDHVIKNPWAGNWYITVRTDGSDVGPLDVDLAVSMVEICPNSCSGHGTCNLQTAECTCGCEENGDGSCETGYFGPACSKVICNATSCGDCTSTPYCTWCEASHQCLTGSPNGGNRPFIVTNCPSAEINLMYSECAGTPTVEAATTTMSSADELPPKLGPDSMGVVCGGRYFLYGGTPHDLHFADLSSFESTGAHPHYFYPAYDFWSFDFSSREWTLVDDEPAPGLMATPSLLCRTEQSTGDQSLILVAGPDALTQNSTHREHYRNDVWEYNIDGEAWTQLAPSCITYAWETEDPACGSLGGWPDGRALFAAADNGTGFFYYGGRAFPDTSFESYQVFEDLWYFDYAAVTWTYLGSPAADHYVAMAGAAVVGTDLYIYGGAVNQYGFDSDTNEYYETTGSALHVLIKFDTTVDPFGGEAWEVIRDGVRDNALAVFGNRMHVVDGRFLYVPGGVTYKSWGSTLPYFFDIVNNNDAGTWTVPPLLFDTVLKRWVVEQTRDNGQPCVLCFVAVHQDDVYQFGGVTDSSFVNPVPTTSLRVRHRSINRLAELEVAGGTPPSARFLHAMARRPSTSSAFVFGGAAKMWDTNPPAPIPDTALHVLDLDASAWLAPIDIPFNSSVAWPDPRLGAVMGATETTLFLFGGLLAVDEDDDGGEGGAIPAADSDLWAFDFDAGSWSVVADEGDGLSPRFASCGAMADGLGMFVIGGGTLGEDGVETAGDSFLFRFDDLGDFDTVEVLPPHTTADTYGASCVYDGTYLWVTGGLVMTAGSEDLNTHISRYDPVAETWANVYTLSVGATQAIPAAMALVFGSGALYNGVWTFFTTFRTGNDGLQSTRTLVQVDLTDPDEPRPSATLSTLPFDTFGGTTLLVGTDGGGDPIIVSFGGLDSATGKVTNHVLTYREGLSLDMAAPVFHNERPSYLAGDLALATQEEFQCLFAPAVNWDDDGASGERSADGSVFCVTNPHPLGSDSVRFRVGDQTLFRVGTQAYTGCDAGSAAASIASDCVACAPGTIAGPDTIGVCRTCPAPLYVDEVGASECRICPAGNYRPVPESCLVCQSGSFSAVDNSTACEACPTDAYQPSNGTTGCLPCPENTDTDREGAVSRAACQCMEGFWSTDQTNCVACPAAGATCPRGTPYPIPDSGYWRDPDEPGLVLACASAAACPGGSDNACGEWYTGRACFECDIGAYRLENACLECPANSALIMIAAGCIALLVSAFVVKFSKNLNSRTGSFSGLGVSFSFFQTTAIFADLDIEWPHQIRAVLDIFSVLNFNIDLASPECTLAVDYRSKWMFQMLIPVFFLGLFVVAFLVVMLHGVIVRCCCSQGCGQRPCCVSGSCRPRSRAGLRHTFDSLVHGFMLLLGLSYVYLTAKALEVFNCQEQTDGTSYLVAYPPMTCWSDEWRAVAVPAVAAIVIYGAGIPGLFIFILFVRFKSFKARGLQNVFKARFGFLTSRYETKHYYWEVVILGRKLGIVVLSMYFASTTMLQSLSVMLLLFVSLLLQVYARPFRSSKDDRLEFVLLCSQYLLLFTGVLYFQDLDETSSALLLAVSLMMVVASGVSIVLYIVMEVRLFLMTRKYRKVANNKEMSAILETADEVFTENGGLFLMDWLRTARPQDRDRLQRLLAAVAETARNKEAHYLELLQPQVAPHMFAFRRSLDAEDKAFLDHMLNFLENHNGMSDTVSRAITLPGLRIQQELELSTRQPGHSYSYGDLVSTKAKAIAHAIGAPHASVRASPVLLGAMGSASSDADNSTYTLTSSSDLFDSDPKLTAATSAPDIFALSKSEFQIKELPVDDFFDDPGSQPRTARRHLRRPHTTRHYYSHKQE